MNILQAQVQYEAARDSEALTVAEWEAHMGLPPFSVYPHARMARPGHVGFHMYSEEERQMATANDTLQILALCALGVRIPKVARLLGLSRVTVWRRINGIERKGK